MFKCICGNSEFRIKATFTENGTITVDGTGTIINEDMLGGDYEYESGYRCTGCGREYETIEACGCGECPDCVKQLEVAYGVIGFTPEDIKRLIETGDLDEGRTDI